MAEKLGIMVCGHGSRNQNAAKEFAVIAEALRARNFLLRAEQGHLVPGLDQGVAPNSGEMDVCTKHESNRELDKRYSNRAAVRDIGRGLQNAADDYNRADQRRPVMRRPVNSSTMTISPFCTTYC